MLIYITMTELSERLNQDHEQDLINLELRKNYIRSRRYRVYTFIILVIIMIVEPIFTSAINDVRGT